MSASELLKLSISELSVQIKARKVSPVELTEAALTQADRLQPTLCSFITILHDQAMRQAKEEEAALARGESRGPLQGIPIGIKDNLATAGIRSTVGSKVLTDHIPKEDAHVVRLCRAAGAIMLGKENLEEFAAGATSNNPHYGAVHNPWALEHIPGGSSGGGGGQCLRVRDLCVAGDRSRRVGAAAGDVLRRGGPQAELRQGQPARAAGDQF